MKIRFHAQARTELRQAWDHYQSISTPLSTRFTSEFLRTLELIVGNPTAWTPVGKRTRRRNLHRFPYAIIYQVNESDLRIMAVAHHKRRHNYWRHRLR